MENWQVLELVFLDLITALDAINHNILIHRVSTDFGITGFALESSPFFIPPKMYTVYSHSLRYIKKFGAAY